MRVIQMLLKEAVGGRQRAEGHLEGDRNPFLSEDHLFTDFDRSLYPVGQGKRAFIFCKNLNRFTICSPSAIDLLQQNTTWDNLFNRESNDKRCSLFWRTFCREPAAMTLDNFAANG